MILGGASTSILGELAHFSMKIMAFSSAIGVGHGYVECL